MGIFLLAIGLYVLALLCACALAGATRAKQETCMEARRPRAAPAPAPLAAAHPQQPVPLSGYR